jgi:D-alanine-D-alanine ligase
MIRAVRPSGAKTRVALLFGGRSGEHPISCATASGVMRAIDRDKYDVVPIGITKEGQWVLTSSNPDDWEIHGNTLPEVTADSGAELFFARRVGDQALRVMEPGHLPEELGDVDVVFPLLHGPFGEDGTVQGFLELADLKYVGCGILASAVGMDKHFMKLALQGAGLAVGPYTLIKPWQWRTQRDECIAAVEKLTFPVFVKPARAGSSLGITRIDSIDQLPAAMEEAQKHDPKVLVEQGIVGREIECAVLGGHGDERPRASIPGEIQVREDGHTFYSFEAKYLDASSRTICPTDLPAEVAAAVQDAAVRTFEAVDGEGLSRVDVFVTPDYQIIVNEINTMPGFTPISMYPQMWEVSGVHYADLIDELIQLALERPTGLR